MAVNSKVRPYKPSWIDRFNNWIEKLPLRVWVFYASLGLGLLLVQILFLWLEGGLQLDVLLPVIIFNALAIPYLLVLISLLDKYAVTALISMRSALAISEPEFEHYQYKLSNMPFLTPLIAGLIVTLMTILTARISIEPVRYTTIDQLPVFEVVYNIIDKSSAFLVGVFIYHSIRQLRLANTINKDHVRINLYHLVPQTFSKLSASTAIGFLVFIYVWMLINPELFTDPVIIGIIVIFTVFAVSVFVWPLYGVHRLMEKEKQRVLNEIGLQFEAVFEIFNQRFHDDENSEIENLNGKISSLDIQHRRVKEFSTWPWRLETVRFVLTAVALPLVLMIIQFLVERALGW